jgi:hypothetical protein
MNYSIFTVKVIKNFGQSFFPDGIALTELIVQVPKVRKNSVKILLQVSVWGKLSYDAAKYYKPDDYIVIEGYLSMSNISIDRIKNLKDKQLEISVFKIYPFIFK